MRSSRPTSGGGPVRRQDRLSLPGESEILGTDTRSLGHAVFVRVLYVGVLILLLWATAYLLTYPEFSVAATRVQGNKLIPTDRIEKAAGVSGRNIFLIDSGSVAESVQRAAPVRDLSVIVSWPSQVTIDVVEYVPAYTWQTGGLRYLLSDTGLAFANTEQADGPTTIADLDNRPIAIGERIDRDVLTSTGYLLRALPPAGLEVARFERSDRLGVVVAISTGPRIAFGDSSDLPAKVSSLRALLATPEYKAARPSFVDVRAQGHPYWR
jgi:cell division septal protein FtsQ